MDKPDKKQGAGLLAGLSRAVLKSRRAPSAPKTVEEKKAELSLGARKVRAPGRFLRGAE
jgi:hypothetical protein